MIADVLLVVGAVGAGIYCFILSKRLNKFNDLEGGMGGAVAVLSAQVDDLTKTLVAAQGTATESTHSLGDLTDRAEAVAKRLELLVVSMQDINDVPYKNEDSPNSENSTPLGPIFKRRQNGA